MITMNEYDVIITLEVKRTVRISSTSMAQAENQAYLQYPCVENERVVRIEAKLRSEECKVS